MTRVTLTSFYNDLDGWSGNLFTARAGTVVTQHTATAFAFTLPAGQDYAGFTVTATGTGFAYLDGDPTAGNITKLVVRDTGNHIVLTMDNFTANGLANSLPQFASNAFGWRFNNDGADADGYITWNHLLSGNDVINGTSGDDRDIQGVNVGNDVFNMYGGNDQVWGSIGRDTIYGGAGDDTLTYNKANWNEGSTAYRGISANMVTGKVVDCWGYTDTFTGIERIEGSRFNDRFVGAGGRDEFVGLRGTDTFIGGANQDRVIYESDFWGGGRRGIVVDLETSFVNGHINGTIRDGFGQIDKTTDIERVEGTRYNDIFVGSRERNVFSGGEGKDSYNGAGGSDVVDLDRNFADQSQTGVSVDLRRASNQIINDGYGNAETTVSIEEIWASHHNDRIIMNGADNFVYGNDGADTMTGAGGNDSFEWYGMDELNDGDRITDFLASGAAGNVDKLNFDHTAFDNLTTTLRLVNGNSATSAAGIGQFVFRAANHTLYWDTNGSAAGGMNSIVVLAGVNALSAADFYLY